MKAWVKVRNKAARVEELCKQLYDITVSGVCPQPLAESIRGRLQFAESQVFGRVAAIMMPEFRARASAMGGPQCISEEMKTELRWAMAFLYTAPPRELTVKDPRKPVILFTDGALEGKDKDKASVGAVIYLEGEVEYFGQAVPSEFLERLQKETKSVIAALELLPVAGALDLWKEKVKNRRVLVFVDNEAAKASLVRMNSDAPSMKKVLRKIAALNERAPTNCWYSRVPSASNPADAPSRLEGLLTEATNAVERKMSFDWLVQ